MTQSTSPTSSLQEQSGEALVACAAASIPDLETLYREHRLPLLRRLVRKAGIERAEDLVQQVFLRLVRRESREAPIEAPAGYLAAAAANALRDLERSARRSETAHHVPLDEEDPAGIDPVRHLEARDRLMRIDNALARMKPLTREIFLARRLDGYSYAEIAQKTGLSVRGVEKQMARALVQLSRFRSDA
ncbi:RNA polymerase sigma factor [Novosphingobium cyanobacteriorum]|uniref:Sigma-70 family RNA polymerase sigma factor n=1 Tax=Novosphingobium cyanobacteriorum TaxID=3024215 RepID=A0ABT6CMW5_9SPHN|nr:sigma-70 family RNA polymerase sigma factor [Novosphingobium cyanobacteriorum]MDF8333677.1 sigma-70 family RNA polymerase sigma factor [Novosphingobium cyanobacteriorum]